MTDPIRARIAAVLQPELCRWIGTAGLEVSRTLAGAVAEALALQPEEGIKPASNHAYRVLDQCAHLDDYGPAWDKASRWVTAWEPQP